MTPSNLRIFCLCIVWLFGITLVHPLWGQETKGVLELSSDQLIVNKKEGTLELSGNIRAHKPNPETFLEADHMLVHRNENNGEILKARATGHPLLLREENRKLTARNLRFDRKKDQLLLNGEVNLELGTGKITAEEILYHPIKEEGTLTEKPGKRVFVAMDKSETQKKLIAKAEKIWISKRANKLILTGDVQVEQPDEKTSFTSDRVEMLLDEASQIEKLIADGSFRMTQVDRTSEADHAIMDSASEIITLYGNAKVFGKDEMRITSDKIEMYLDVTKGVISGSERSPIRITVPIK